MNYFAVNWLAIVVATVASMALGFVWYMALSKPWMAAVGKTREELQPNDPSPYIWSVVVQLVIAYFVALLTPAVFGATNWTNGALLGIHAWVGFVITAMILNHRYQGARWSLTIIDGGYLLAVVVVQGIVIGLFG